MTMQRNGFVGTPITMHAEDRHADRMRHLRLELLQAASSRAHVDSPWFVLRVDYGRELAVEKALHEAEIECSVPMRKGREVRRRHRILKGQMIPVITGYVMVRCTPSADAFLGLTGVEHVLGMLGGVERPHRVPDEEVKRFNDMAGEGAFDWDRIGAALQVGQKVRAIYGAFVGLTGQVVTCRQDKRGDAVVEFEVFGRTVPTVLPLAILEGL